MKRSILLVAFLVFAAAASFAHGKGEHVMGKVTAMADSSITVQTNDMSPVIVYTTAETKYQKSGAVASMQDLQVGDRVVIHAVRINNKLLANEARR
jgi:ribosomal protein S17